MRKTFEQYHAENPEVYKDFEYYANATILKGFKHYGAKAIFELIRWHRGTRATGEFKINNNYTCDYARLFMKLNPQYEGFFRTRQVRKK